MASRENWCAEKVSSLIQEDLRIPTLHELKEFLQTMPQQEAAKICQELQLPLIFDCLNDSNSEQVELACEVLSICMNNLTLGESTRRYDVALERALRHPHPMVKLLALTEISRAVQNEEALDAICHKTQLLKNIISCMAENDLAPALKASEILCNIGVTNPGVQVLIKSDIKNSLFEVMSINGVVRLRVFELLVNICTNSEFSLEHLKQSGLISPVLEELNNNDILLRMNVVELVTELGLTRHGYNFLEQNGVLTKVFDLIDDNEDLVTVQICEPGVLKFFGCIASCRPIELLSKYPKLFDRLFSNIESGDLIIVGVTLDTLGHIAKSNEGKCALQSTGNKMAYAIKTIVKLLGSLPTEVKIHALNCLENIIRVTEIKSDVGQITRKWFNLFGDEPMDVVLRYAKNPFSEIRLAGLGILMAIAGQTWGQETIRNTPGLLEFLMDRSVESIKECKEIKYEVVKLLSHSPVFDQTTLTSLEQFIREGPFYVHTVTEVAIEGNE